MNQNICVYISIPIVGEVCVLDLSLVCVEVVEAYDGIPYNSTTFEVEQDLQVVA